jgi:hypothetical protein
MPFSGQIDSLPDTAFAIRASGTVWNHGPWRSQDEQASPTTPAFGHPSSPRRGPLFRACSFFLASFPSAGFPSAAILRQSTLPLLGEEGWPKAGVVGHEPKLNHYRLRKSRQTEQGLSGFARISRGAPPAGGSATCAGSERSRNVVAAEGVVNLCRGFKWQRRGAGSWAMAVGRHAARPVRTKPECR